jgi:hypothetical protein
METGLSASNEFPQSLSKGELIKLVLFLKPERLFFSVSL